MSKGAQIAGGATVIALLLGWYASSNLEANASFTYYRDLADFQADEGARLGESARVHGYVTPGSIDRDVEGRQVRFAMQGQPPHAGGESASLLPVVFTSLETPDLFKDGAEVVVEGRMNRTGGSFRATNVLAKCPSKFEAAAAAGETPPGTPL